MFLILVGLSGAIWVVWATIVLAWLVLAAAVITLLDWTGRSLKNSQQSLIN